MSYNVEETEGGSLGEPRNADSDTEDAPPLSDEDVRLAATYVNDARNGNRGNFKTDPKSVRLYNLYNEPAFFWTSHMAVGALLSLVLFEDPAVPSIRLDYWITMCVELFCVCLIFSRLAHQGIFSSEKNFWRSKRRLPTLVILLLTLLDMALYVILSELGVTSVRFSRPLRPLLLLCMDRAKQLRGVFKNILLTLPDIITVLTLFLLSVAFFALMALKIFQNRQDLVYYSDGQPYMHNYLDNFFHLYVLVTTANFPDVMMPAFDYNPWFTLFFIIYLIICLYLFMSICLATIYNNFKEHLKEYVEDSVREKQNNLQLAFDILKVETEAGEEELLPRSRWMSLMRTVHPKRLDLEHSLLWDVLAGSNQTGYISKKEFFHVVNLLDMRVLDDKGREPEFQRWFPRCFRSRISRLVRKAVANRFFRYFIDLAVVANAVCIALDQDDAEWFFMVLFILEILLKFYVFGLKKFFRSAMNIFDFILIVAALVINVLELAWKSISNQSGALDFLLVLRLLRLVRLVYAIERFRIVLKTISSIGRSLLTYGAVLFVFFYIFAIIGMEAFAGRITPEPFLTNRSQTRPITCGNPRLNGTQFAMNRYCNNNFNDILHSFVVLFELMVVNQWHVLAEGFVAVTHQAARIYFIIYHLLVVILVLNIFSAFILELFMLEYTVSKEPAERKVSAVVRRITVMGLNEDESAYMDDIEEEEATEDDSEMAAADYVRGGRRPSIRFMLPRGGNKVEELLQKMYEIEREEDDNSF
ncbi:PREDICTED: two pore calcium channel protein 1-like [Branchiostoma belcheri]|uniref:Two pore calcium channel protein 1-like n=1 Tax=Branchiostoma belcheri TaxID=7741 RepID=A0A6P5A2T9_BRABE|nr:PREDICTED: two pore calcium channel protein 1-like [Branchiostoma belcheri]